MPRYSETYYNEEYYTQTLFEAGFFVGVLEGTPVVYSVLEARIVMTHTDGKVLVDPVMLGKMKLSG